MRYSEIYEYASTNRVDELLDTTVEYLVTINTRSKFVAEKTINDRIIKFIAEYQDNDDGLYMWEVMFAEYDVLARPGTTRGKFGVTGSGGELTVLSMMVTAMDEFITMHQPDVILFSAAKETNTDSRSKVYDRMLARHLPKGYMIKKVINNSSTDFRIERVY